MIREWRSSNWLAVSAAALLVAFVGSARAQEQTSTGAALTLREAVATALRSNPVMKVVESGQTLAREQLAEARTGRLPTLQFSETFTHSNNPVFVFGSLLEQGRFGPANFALEALNSPESLSNFRSALNLRLPLFNRFQTETRIRQATLGQDMAEAQREMAEQQLRFGVIQAYYGVLIAEARKLVTEEAAAASEAEVKRIRDLHAQGVVVASDLLAMEVQLADFKQQQIQAAGDVAAAYAYLNTAMGQPIGSRPSIAGELKDAVFPAVTEESLIETALGRRQDYRQLSLELAARRQDVRASRGQYWPDLNLFAGVGHSGKDLAGGSSDYAVGASLTVNLVDFGRTSRIRQAVASRQAAEAQKDRKAAEIRLEVVRANQYYRAAEAKLKVAAGAVDQAAEAYRIAGDRHGVGLTTVTEVLRAQTALVRARMSLLAARYDYYVGYAQTLLATGQLNDVTPLAL